MKFDITPCVEIVLQKIEERKGNCWVVGGAVRDALLNKQVKDIDLATDLPASEVETIVEELKYPRIASIRDFDHGIIRFCNPDTKEIVDIATLRKDDSCDGRFANVSFTKDIYEDLKRRDLTINAFAVKIMPNGSPYVSEEISQADNTCLRDIKDKVIRFVGNPEDRVQEDYLRMIRACRFMTLGPDWVMGGTDEQAIRKFAHEIVNVPKERIHDEIVKALSSDYPSKFFRSLHDCGLLRHIMPDLELGYNCTQNIYHKDTVFEHLMLTLDAACQLSKDPMFRLAAVTHDIAKPHTKEEKSGVGCTFYKHEVIGATIMYKWMQDYRFPKKDAEYVSKLIRWHMFRFEDNSSDKAIRKFLQEVGKDTWRDLFSLRLADRKGNRAKAGKSEIPKAIMELTERIIKMLAEGTPIFKEDLAINGKDILELGVPPGPVYKDIFSNLLGIVIADPAKNTKAWCTQFIEKNYVNKETDDKKEKEAEQRSE